MSTVTASQLQRNFGKYKAQAQREPLVITDNGRESLVIMSVEDFHRLRKLDDRQVFHTSDEPPHGLLEALDQSILEMSDLKAAELKVVNF